MFPGAVRVVLDATRNDSTCIFKTALDLDVPISCCKLLRSWFYHDSISCIILCKPCLTIAIPKTCTNFVWFAAASWTHSTRSPGRTLGRASVQVVSARRGDVSLFLFGSWHPSWKLRQQTGWPNLLRNHVITPQRKKAYGILWRSLNGLSNRLAMFFSKSKWISLGGFPAPHDLWGVLFFNAPEHVLQNIQAYTTDELCMVDASVGWSLWFGMFGGTILGPETTMFHGETR